MYTKSTVYVAARLRGRSMCLAACNGERAKDVLHGDVEYPQHGSFILKV